MNNSTYPCPVGTNKSIAGKRLNPVLIVLSLMLCFCTSVVQAQVPVTVTNPTNTTPNLQPGYASLTLALADLNVVTAMSGSVTLTLNGGNAETAPPTGFVIGSASLNAVLSASNTVTIVSNGVGTVTLNAGVGTATPGSAAPDGIISIRGADYVTIDGLTLTDGNAANPATMEFGIGLFKLGVADGANNNTIRNCIINMQRINNATGTAPLVDGSAGIGVYNSTAIAATTVLTPTVAAGSNSNNKFYTNTINGGNIGIAIIGYAASTPFTVADQNNDIGGSSAATGNNILNFGGAAAATNPAAGVRTLAQYGLNVSYNTINNNNGSGVNHVSTLRGIYTNTATSASETVGNNIITVKGGGTTSQLTAIENVAGSTATTNTIAINNNNITTTYTTATSGVSYGVYNNAASPANLNVNGNTFNMSSASTSGTLYCINQVGSVATSCSISNNNITSQVLTAAGSTAVRGISNSTMAATCNLTANSNNITGVSLTGAQSGEWTFMLQTVSITNETIGSNTITNVTIPSTGVTYLINANNTSTGTISITNNSIVTQFSKNVSNSSNFFGLYNFGSPVGTQTISGNNFSNITLNGSAGITALSSTGQYGIFWATSASATHIFTNNTVSNVTENGTGMFQAMGLGYGLTNTVTGNTVSNATGAGIMIGMAFGNSSTVAMNASGNTVSGVSSTGASGAAYGMYILSSNGVINYFGNTISGISVSGATSPVAAGINVVAGITANIYKNKIYDISASAAIATTAGAVSGISIAAGTTVNIYNNLIGDLRAPLANLTDAIRGIAVNSTTVSTSYNIYNNTIYLNATSTGTNFGTTGIYHAASTTASTAKLDLRNNIIINLSTANGTGITSVLRRSAAATLDNYATTSNRNLYYAGTPGAQRAIMNDNGTVYGTSASGFAFGPVGTAGSFKNFVTASREASSFAGEAGFTFSTAGSFFQSLNGSSPVFLHLVPSIITQAESGASVITSPAISDDYDGDTRSVTLPDIGADEFIGVTPAPSITGASVPTGTCVASAHTINASITTPTGTITSVTLNYNNGAAGNTSMSFVSGSTYTGSIPAASPGNTLVTWTITATNSAGVSTIYTGTSYQDEPLTGLAATAVASPATICAGTSSVLTAALSKTGNVTFGTGSATTTVENGPFYSNWSNKHMQIMMKASELSASGLLAGNLTNIKFYITAIDGTDLNQNFSIKMAQTANADMSSFLTTGLTEVYANSAYSPIVGTNSINLSTPYAWDGSSNLVIDICFGTASTSATITSTALADATSFVSVIKTYTASATASATACPNITTNLSTYSVRPQISLVGNAAPAITAISWSDGSGVVGTTNPLSVSPSSTTAYSATITAAGCTTTTNTTTVTTIPLPAPPNANNSSQCGTGFPAAFVTTGGGGGGFKWYSAQTGGTLIQNGGGTYTTNQISTTTHFWVSESNGTCESARAEVIATVAPADPVQASVNFNNPCLNTGISLSAANTAAIPVNSYTYSWNASPLSGSGLSGATAGNPLPVTPAAAGTYTYTVTATDATAGCTTTSSVTVTVKALPLIYSAVAAPAIVCAGTNSVLTALTASIAAGTATIGGGATTTTDYNGPFYSNWSNKHMQIMMRASELSAAGMQAGNMTGMTFYTTTIDGTDFNQNFSLKMAQTANADMSAFVSSGLTEVYAVATYSPVVGANSITFTTPFNWNGTSNIVFDICFGNSGSSATISSTAVADATASFVSVIKTYTASATSSATACPNTTTNSSTYSVRPKISISGQVGSTGAGTINWLWQPGALPGNSVTVAPSTTTIFTVTATDPATTCSKTAPVTVTVNPLPPTPAGTNGTDQCGTAPTDASVSSNNTTDPQSPPFFKWYFVPTGGTAQQSGTAHTFTTPITATTDFYVSEVSVNGCEGPRVHISTIVSTADQITVNATHTTVCLGGSTDISASYTPDFNSFATFTLTATGGAASGLPGAVPLTPNVTGNGSNPYTVTPTATGTYTYTITANDPDKGCSSVGTITVTVGDLPIVSSATATPAVICAGSNSVLEAKSNIGAPLSIKIGTGTTGFTGAANPYWNSNSADGSKFQFLYKASDLQGLGLTAGPINGLIYKITTTPIPAAAFFNNFSISMGHTAATVMTTTWQPGMQLVMNPINHVPVTGNNSYTFDNAFVWDGVSNIVIQVCYDNDPNNTCTCTGSTLAVEYTVVSYVCSAYYYETNSSNPARDMCGSTAAATTQSNLPNVTFVRGYTNNTSLYNWQWNPGALPGAIVNVNPTGSTTYTVTATDPSTGCSRSVPVTLTVNPLPAAVSTNDPVTRCGPGAVTLTATGTGGSLKWYNVSTGGTSLFTGGSYTTNVVVGNTSFWVAETSAAGCEGPRTQVHVTATTPPTLAITPSAATTFCKGLNVTLNGATGSDPGYTNFTWSASPSVGAGLSGTTGSAITVTPTVAGTYTITLTANDGQANGCANITTITVTVNPNPLLSSAIANPATICAGGVSNLLAQTSTIGTANQTLGAGGTNSTTYDGIFYHLFGGVKTQFLVKASELSGIGILPGNITALGINMSTVTSMSYDAFTINIAPTSQAAMTTTLVSTGFTQVFTNSSYSPVTGINTFTFGTGAGSAASFAWDGTSNIVIQFCWSNNTSGGQSNFAKTDAPGFVSCAYYRADSQSPSILCPQTSGTSTTSARPQFIFTSQTGTTGPGTYNWTWNPGSLNGNSVNVSPASTATYTATATDPVTGCFTNSSPVTVSVLPVGANATASPATPVCAGTSVTLNGGATGGAPFTYAWASTPAGTYAATATINVTPAVTTTYTVTVTDACTNATTSSVTVTVNPLPTASIQEGPGPLNICSPSTQLLTAVTNAGAATYQWTLNGTNIAGATGAAYTVSGVSTGTYRVIVTNTATNCVSAPSAGVVVTINAKPSAVTITPATATICNGGSTGLIASGGTIGGAGNASIGAGAGTNGGFVTTGNEGFGNPYNYWYGNQKTQYIYTQAELNAAGITAGNINSLSFETTALGATQYSMTGFTINMGSTLQSAAVPAPITTGLTQVYTNATQPITLGVNTYSFSTPFVWNGTSNIVLSVCWANSTTGSNANVATVKSDVAPFVSTTILYNDNTFAICAATTSSRNQTSSNRPKVVFGYSAVIATTFTWLPATELNTASGATVTASPSVTRTYTATATSPAGCTNSGTAIITVNPRPTGVITGDATYCAGQGSTTTTLSIAVTGAGPWSGTLSPGTIPFSGTSSPITVSVTPSSTTTYTIATLNGSQCSSIAADLTGSATVTINPVPATPTITPAGPVTQCGGTVILTASSPGQWQWNLNGSPIGGATNQTLVVSASGNYSVTVTNESNCSVTSAATSVTINPVPATPTISAGGPTTFCAGGSVTLTSSSATGNQWNLNGSPLGGATNATLVVTASGDYTVTVTNGFGCSATSAITTVTVNPLAANPTATVVQPTCALGTGTINVTAPLGGGNTYSLDGINFQSSPSFPGQAPGTYTVYVHNAAGCFSPATTNVTVNPQPFVPGAPVITGIVNVCPFVGVSGPAGQLTYTATATGNGTQTFAWVVPPTNVTIVSGQGTATLVLSFQNGFATQPNKQIRLTVTNQCGPSPMTIYYLAAQIPNTPAPIVGPTDACPLLNGPAVTYTIPKAPGAKEYFWSVPQVGAGTTVTHPNGTGNVNDTVITVAYSTAFTGGTITVYSSNDCGVSGVRSITVTRNGPSQPNVISGPTNACPYITPNTPATYTVPAVPGVTYAWVGSNGAIMNSPQGSNTMSVTYPIGYTSGTISVTASTGCGTSIARTLTITTLNPATPGVPDVIQTHFCGEPGGRKYTYTLSAMPSNATSVLWTVPAGATFLNLSPVSIEVTYPNAAVNGVVTVQAANPCASSVIRSVNVKLPACPVGFAGNNNGTNGTAESKGAVKAAKATAAPVLVETIEVKIFPNPTVSDFKLEVLTSGTEEITVRVLDNQGRLYKNFKVMPYQTIALGAELKAGSYLIEVRQGKTVKTTKVIKF